MRIALVLAVFAIASCKKDPSKDDPFAAPSNVQLAPAAGEAPKASERWELSAEGLRAAASIANATELREATKNRALRERLSEAATAHADVLLYVDRATPYDLVYAAFMLMGTGGVSSDHVEVATLGNDGRTASIRLGPPRGEPCPVLFPSLAVDAGPVKPNLNAPPCLEDPGLAATVNVELEGIAVTATGANLAMGCDSLGPGLAIRGRDFASLKFCLAHLKKLHAEFGSERAVRLSASPSMRFEEVAPVLAAVRKDDQGDLLPDVTFGPPR